MNNLKLESLAKLLSVEKVTSSYLAKTLKISRMHAWRIIKGKSSPGRIFISRFFKKYPDAKYEEYFF